MTDVSVVAPAGDLATRQAELIAALVAGRELPAGFDHARLSAARHAMLVKRAQQVAKAWPLLAASFGNQWTARFTTWAATHPPEGAWCDGRRFRRSQRRRAGAAAPSPACPPEPKPSPTR